MEMFLMLITKDGEQNGLSERVCALYFSRNERRTRRNMISIISSWWKLEQIGCHGMTVSHPVYTQASDVWEMPAALTALQGMPDTKYKHILSSTQMFISNTEYKQIVIGK